MRVLETDYNGYRFRSRTDARWAVFFRALSIRFEYETEGFDLDDVGFYLPDFWLPDYQCWVEIKGDEPDTVASAKAGALCEFTRRDTFLFVGQPKYSIARHAFHYDDDDGSVYDYSFFMPAMLENGYT